MSISGARTTRSVWLAAVLGGLLLPGAAPAQLVLATGGRSTFEIVVDPQGSEPERFAAHEVKRYLELATGARFPVVNAASGPNRIVVGRAAGELAPLRDARGDSYLVRIASGQITLAGVSGRATLFSAYDFLERYAGCGWLVPGDEHVPVRTELSLPASAEHVEIPAFDYRAISLFPYDDSQIGDRLRSVALFPYALAQVTKDRIDWAAKNRINWVHPCPNERGIKLWEKVRSREEIVPEIVKRGLGLHYGGHSYFAWLPPEKYFKDHPEYYATIQNGKPETLNLANPDVADVMARNMGEFLDKNPEIEIVTVWMNDAPAICTTPGCLKMEGPVRLSISSPEDGYPPVVSFSNAALKFTNEVARRLRKTHPKIMVNHLAYNELIDAPTLTKPEPNVLVAFAPIQRAQFKIGGKAGYFRPLNDPENEVNRKYLTEIRKWLALSDNFYVWDYYSLWWTLGSNRPRWQFPAMEAMSADLRFYRDNLRLTRVSSEIADWHEENMYVFAKLAWNPDASWKDSLEDFCRRSYGRAARTMMEHWMVLQDAKENWFRHRGECQELLRKALKEAETADVRRRINRIAELWLESECHKEGDSVGACKP